MSLGNDQYPKSVNGAMDTLAQHQFDKAYLEKKTRQQNQGQKN